MCRWASTEGGTGGVGGMCRWASTEGELEGTCAGRYLCNGEGEAPCAWRHWHGQGAHPHRRWHREGHQAGGRASTVRSRADKPVGLGEGQDPWKCWVSGLQGPTAQKEKNWAS